MVHIIGNTGVMVTPHTGDTMQDTTTTENTTTETPRFAIRNGIKTAHKVIAVCEIWTYDVWGNRRDGFEVNDRACQSRDTELICTMEIANVPAFPGASDNFRAFSASGSFSAELALSFSPDTADVARLFGYTAGQVETDGDDLTIELTRKRDGYPIGQVVIVAWKDITTGETADAKY